VAQDGDTPLLFAASYGNVDTVRCLVENGANKEAATTNGWTPLLIAALKGHVDTVRYLVENGANKDAADKNGKKPRDVACIEYYKSDKEAKKGEILALLG